MERGFAGHVHKSTWMAVHNRKWASDLAHWSKINIADKRESISKIINTKSGVKLVNDKDEFRYPKDMWDVHECIRYYNIISLVTCGVCTNTVFSATTGV